MSTHAGYAKQIGHDVICRWRAREVEVYLPRKPDPFALPDQRFRRARLLVDHGILPSPQWDDPWVRQTTEFLSERARCVDKAPSAELVRRWPHLYEAYQIYSAGRFPSWELEARLLAAEPIAQIALKCKVPAQTIETYQEVFFSVADKLRACDWVMNIVLGPRIHYGLAESAPIKPVAPEPPAARRCGAGSL